MLLPATGNRGLALVAVSVSTSKMLYILKKAMTKVGLRSTRMNDEPKVSLTMVQHLAILVAYRGLASDIKNKTKFSPPLKDLNKILGQSFKTKKEAFAFIHDMLEYNGEETLDICGMGDCPAIKENDMPAPSVGIYQVTWQEDVGVQSKQTKLCQECKDYLVERKVIQDI